MQSVLTLPLILLLAWFFLGGTLFWSTRLIRVASPTLMRCMVVMLVYVIINGVYGLLAYLMKLHEAEVINLLVAVCLSTFLFSYMLDIELISGFFIFLLTVFFQIAMLLLITFLFSLQLVELHKIKDLNLLKELAKSTSSITDFSANQRSQFEDEN